MAGVPVVVGSLEDVEAGVQAAAAMAAAQHVPPLPVNFRLRRDAPLSNCAALKARVRAGASLHRLLNPELLDTKFFAYLAIQEGYERVIREGTEHANLQINGINECLNSLVRNEAVEPEQMPHRQDRGKGVHQYIHLDAAPHNPYRPYHANVDCQPIIHVANVTEEIRTQEQGADRLSQQETFRANIRMLELSKKLFTEFKTGYETAFRRQMAEALEEDTDIGGGYADFRMLTTMNQQSYNMDYPDQ